MAREMVERIVCDLCKSEALGKINPEKTNSRTCNQEAYYKDTDGNEWLAILMPIRYTDLDSDGYPLSDRFVMRKLDLCPNCQKRVLDELPIVDDGIRGLSFRIKE